MVRVVVFSSNLSYVSVSKEEEDCSNKQVANVRPLLVLRGQQGVVAKIFRLKNTQRLRKKLVSPFSLGAMFFLPFVQLSNQ